ncbi:hypothetical protein TNCV_501261 [Trichonephila clavipes]|nr:hypothetical protein TNCV_501261 [Trichonephila clavipes]
MKLHNSPVSNFFWEPFFLHEHYVTETVITRIRTVVAWGPGLIDRADTAVSMSLTKANGTYVLSQPIGVIIYWHMIANSAHTTLGDSRLPAWRVILTVGDCCNTK